MHFSTWPIGDLGSGVLVSGDDLRFSSDSHQILLRIKDFCTELGIKDFFDLVNLINSTNCNGGKTSIITFAVHLGKLSHFLLIVQTLHVCIIYTHWLSYTRNMFL